MVSWLLFAAATQSICAISVTEYNNHPNHPDKYGWPVNYIYSLQYFIQNKTWNIFLMYACKTLIVNDLPLPERVYNYFILDKLQSFASNYMDNHLATRAHWLATGSVITPFEPQRYTGTVLFTVTSRLEGVKYALLLIKGVREDLIVFGRQSSEYAS